MEIQKSHNNIQQMLKEYNRRPQLPGGADSFLKILTEKRTFVDKSMLIKELIQHRSEVIVLMDESRCGKSLNLQIFNLFLRSEHNKQGEIVNYEANKKLFMGGVIQTKINGQNSQIQLSPLKISNEITSGGILEAYFCSTPVIYMSWQSVISLHWLQVKQKLAYQIKKQYLKHPYLVNFSHLYTYWLDTLSIIQNPSCQPKTIQKALLGQAIQQLTQLLYEFHGKRVYILIDAYDRPFNAILEYQFMERDEKQKWKLQQDSKKIAQLINQIFIPVLKDNEWLESAVLTGDHDNSTKQPCLLGLNNIKFISIRHTIFAEFYRFTAQQIQNQILAKILKDEVQNQQQQQDISELKHRLLNMIDKSCVSYEVEEQDRQCKLYNPHQVNQYLIGCISRKQILQSSCRIE